MAKAKTTTSVAVDSIRHQDTRKNIPTNELREFMAEDEQTPKTMRYSRDPSLDPQLVWKGKDEQDGQDLTVQVVPIYIQEKIHPQALINALPRQQENQQLDLFADFDGLDDFDQKVDFYHHEQHWANRMILGDSLLVMTSLAEKEGLKGKVQTIYFDPPYGIKFGSNWQVSTRKRDVKDGKAEDATRQPEQVRAFRDTWKLGVHSYLAYMRDRLIAARELLTETGSIFVQIGDENMHLVRSILDEVFGSENFVSIIPFKKTSGQSATLLGNLLDFIVWYGKNKEQIKYRQLYESKEPREQIGIFYDHVELGDGTRRKLNRQEIDTLKIPEAGRVFQGSVLYSEGATSLGSFAIMVEDRKFTPPTKAHWKTSENGMRRLLLANRVFIKGNTPRYVRYFDDFRECQIKWVNRLP